jgi:hypothetical protein
MSEEQRFGREVGVDKPMRHGREILERAEQDRLDALDEELDLEDDEDDDDLLDDDEDDFGDDEDDFDEEDYHDEAPY